MMVMAEETFALKALTLSVLLFMLDALNPGGIPLSVNHNMVKSREVKLLTDIFTVPSCGSSAKAMMSRRRNICPLLVLTLKHGHASEIRPDL